MIEVERTATSRSDPAILFALLKDGSSWPRWTIFTAFELERPGRDDPLGPGAIRVFSTHLTRAREEVVTMEAGRSLGYRLLSGLPLGNYVAEIVLDPLPEGGTHIRWTARFGPQRWGTGWFWRWFIGWTLARVASDLARA